MCSWSTQLACQQVYTGHSVALMWLLLSSLGVLLPCTQHGS